jgi:hypothetical protein
MPERRGEETSTAEGTRERSDGDPPQLHHSERRGEGHSTAEGTRERSDGDPPQLHHSRRYSHGLRGSVSLENPIEREAPTA